ncbi:uncharacterized protein HMPREF1541_08269 [Cyphellophora europaea CBS 101466]|uniref:Ubiquitin-like domain-containing protein n=1 Tax=Cyphellophora europaea (strain CBS 101466) TaxID=1220924 RepID=W2RNK0_CYPE1|nr:uncharacterized protein HMPREF1541_08269 [Cyphellophora europaea CBS 101466]ETN37278.1 hypothetical protein HMPREF1541_08269 [Cyphellophora europaea CBS 101466]
MSSLADSLTSIGPSQPDLTSTDESDEAWDLECVDLKGIDALSVSQLKSSLIAWMKKQRATEAELEVTKATRRRATMRMQDEILELKRELWVAGRAADVARRERVRGELRAEIEKELAIPPKLPPVKLEDAIGRHFLIPFDKCKQWRDMQLLIEKAFDHVEGLSCHVYTGRYDLLGPDNEILMAEYWEQAVRPGMTIKQMLWPIRERSRSTSHRRSPASGVEIIDLNPPASMSSSTSSAGFLERRRSIDVLDRSRASSPGCDDAFVTSLSEILGNSSLAEKETKKEGMDELDSYDVVAYEDVLPGNRPAARSKDKRPKRTRSTYGLPCAF